MKIGEITVSTAKAAELTGWGYESFRARLKEGMLKATGAHPKAYGREVQAEEVDAKRWTWSRFGIRDLCSFRLIRVLMDAGLSFDEANGIASDNELWRCWRGADDFLPVEKWPAVFIVAGRSTDGAVEWSIHNTSELPSLAGAAYAAAEGRARRTPRATAKAANIGAFWGKSDHVLIFAPAHLIRWRIGQALIALAGDVGDE